MALFHVIDDEEYMCELIDKILAMNGHETLAFHNPCHYLEYLDGPDRDTPAAVITDILMPAMNGYELIGEILQRNSDQKFIIISGTPHVDARTPHHACHYLCKPFRIAELIDMARSIVDCDSTGPSPTLECGSMGDRELFISEWHCPVPQGKRLN